MLAQKSPNNPWFIKKLCTEVIVSCPKKALHDAGLFFWARKLRPLNGDNIVGRGTLAAFYNIKLHFSALFKGFVPVTFNGGKMDKNIRSISSLNKAKTLCRIKPLYYSLHCFLLLLSVLIIELFCKNYLLKQSCRFVTLFTQMKVNIFY